MGNTSSGSSGPAPASSSTDRALYRAISQGDIATFTKLLSKKSKSRSGTSSLTGWCADPKILQQFAAADQVRHENRSIPPSSSLNPINNPDIKIDPQSLNRYSKFNPIPSNPFESLNSLMLACHFGHTGMVDSLLSAGADATDTTESGRTALIIAAERGRARIVQQVVEWAEKKFGRTSPDFVAFVNAKDENGQTALLHASSMGFAHIVDYLCDHGASVNVADYLEGMTPLLWAAEHGPASLVRRLIQLGAEVNHRNHQGQTPLIRAASKNFMYKELVQDGAPIRESAVGAVSPWEIVDCLIRSGTCDVNAKNHDGYSALMVASWQGHISVVERLLDAGVNVNDRAEKGQTALMLAAGQCQSLITQRLIHSGAEVSFTDEKGESALMKAAARGDVQIVRWLLEAGAAVDGRDNLRGYSALHMATLGGHFAIAEQLIAKGADCNAANHIRETPVLTAVRKGHIGIVRLLCEAGADLNEPDRSGETPLIAAARSANEAIAQTLLEYERVDPNRRSLSDDCALSVALLSGQTRVVELLIAAGAATDIQIIKDGKPTPFDQCTNGDLGMKAAVERGVKERPNWVGRLKKSSTVSKPKEFSVLQTPAAAQRSPSQSQSHSHPPSLAPQLTMGPSTSHSVRSSPSFADIPLIQWRLVEVLAWLDSIGLSQYAPQFSESSVDGSVLLELDEELMTEELKIDKKLHRMKLVKQIERLKKPRSEEEKGETEGKPNNGNANGQNGSSANTTSSGSGGSAVPSPAVIPLVPSLGSLSSMSQVPMIPTNSISQASNSVPSSVLQLASHISESGTGANKPIFFNEIHLDFDALMGTGASGAAAAEPTKEVEKVGKHVLVFPPASPPTAAPASPGSAYVSPLTAADFLETGVQFSSTSAAPTRPIPDPRRIPSSEVTVQNEIGRGSFGTVYRGIWRGAAVAIKRIHEEYLLGQGLQHCLREAGLMELLGNHSNIVRMYGVCVESNPPQFSFIMEYFPRGSIRSLLNETPQLPLKDVASMARDIACGMLHLHLEGVIHRDLAARNLLIDENRRIRIADFGISRLKSLATVVNRTTSNFISAKWSSPESLLKQEYSEKSDTYSYAIVLWELLTGREPHQDLTDLETAMKIAQDKSFRPAIPSRATPALSKLIEDCWDADPAKRPDFQTVLEKFEEIQKEAANAQESSPKSNTA